MSIIVITCSIATWRSSQQSGRW